MQQPIVSVRGEAEIVVAPEIATVTVTVLVRERTREKAEQQLVDLSAAIGEVLTRNESALRRHSASAVSLYPLLRNRKSDRAEAYQARRGWSVEVHDFAALPTILGELTVSDAVTIDGPFWEVETGSPVHQRARAAAVQDVVRRARSYAEAFGARIDKLVEVSDTGLGKATHIQAFGMPAAGGAMTRSAQPIEQLDLEPTEQRIFGSIEARFTMTEPDLDRLS